MPCKLYCEICCTQRVTPFSPVPVLVVPASVLGSVVALVCALVKLCTIWHAVCSGWFTDGQGVLPHSAFLQWYILCFCVPTASVGASASSFPAIDGQGHCWVGRHNFMRAGCLGNSVRDLDAPTPGLHLLAGFFTYEGYLGYLHERSVVHMLGHAVGASSDGCTSQHRHAKPVRFFASTWRLTSTDGPA